MSETEMWGSGDISMPCKREDLSLSPQDPRESLALQHASVPMMRRIKRQEPPEAGGQLALCRQGKTDPFQTVRKARTDR